MSDDSIEYLERANKLLNESILVMIHSVYVDNEDKIKGDWDQRDDLINRIRTYFYDLEHNNF